MKKLLNLIICSTVILALSSCDVFNDKKQNQETKDNATTIEGISQEIKGKIAAQDTLMSALELKVDTLAQALTQVQRENAKLKAQITKLESPKSTWGYMTHASLVIAIIALILSLLKKGISRKKIDEIFSHNLDKSQRMVELEDAVSQLKSGQNNRDPHTSVQEISVRLQTVESTLSKINEVHNMPLPAAANRQRQSHQSPKPEYQKVGYAKNDMDKYFRVSGKSVWITHRFGQA